MRILAIRGERLASLHDPFEIDFQAPPLADAGLFAITGPTGAGKSTILDAVCLALYGDTPRVQGSGGPAVSLGLGEGEDDEKLGVKDPRHLLSRGSRQGSAEVDFRGRDGFDYRAKWFVPPRPRAKTLAAPDMALIRMADQVVLATGLASTRRMVEQLLGFTFSEFQKAVLLPQGQFAEFLGANALDRAAILEKVAGGEIYARLGTLAGARQAAEQRALDLLEAESKGHQPLTEEIRAATSASRDAAVKEVLEARAREQAARDALKWHEEALRLAKACSGAEAGLAEASKAVAAAAPRRLELAEVERALLRRETLAELRRTELTLASATADHQGKVLAATEATRSAEAARTKATDATTVYSAVGEEVARSGPELQEARRLDGESARSVLAERSASKEESDASEAARVAGVSVERAIAASQVQERARDEASAWLTARESEAAVVLEWPRWRELIVRHEKAAARAAAARTARDSATTPEAVAKVRARAELAISSREAALVFSLAKAAALEAAEKLERQAEERAARAKEALQQARQAQGLSSHRAELKPGEACPLCGSLEHPWTTDAKVDALVQAAAQAEAACSAESAAAKAGTGKARNDSQAAGNALVKATTESEKLAEAAANLSLELERAGRAKAEAELARAEADLHECEQALALPFDPVPGWRAALATGPKALLADWEGRAEEHGARRTARDAAATALSEAGNLLVAARSTAVEKDATAARARTLLGLATEELKRIQEERARLLGGRPVVDVEKALIDRLKLADFAREKARSDLGKAEQGATRATTDLEGAVIRLGQAESGAVQAAASLDICLAELKMDRPAFEARVGRGEGFVKQEREALARLDAAQRDASTLHTERLRAVEAHGVGRPLQTPEGAEKERLRASEVAVAADERRIEFEAALQSDATARAALVAIAPRLEAQRAKTRIAAELGELIGAGGAKSFRTFAQGLALDTLLGHANRHLEQLAPRYRLARVPGTDMELQVVDQDLGGTARGVNSLSGGETFLVSLGLALGLSGLVTRAIRVESLFVDEGFGTLDPASLDQAMAVLEGLRATGRTVGIISHVPELHERIGVLVQVEKTGAGRSRIRTVRVSDTA